MAINSNNFGLFGHPFVQGCQRDGLLACVAYQAVCAANGFDASMECDETITLKILVSRIYARQ